MVRGTLLRVSGSRWLGSRLPRTALGRRAASRFMPGERLEDALAAAVRLRRDGLGTVLTYLGEEVADEARADEAAAAFGDALGSLAAAGLEPQVSVKPTQLGLVLDAAGALARTERLAAVAAGVGGVVWIDMEGSAHTDATLDMYERLRAGHANVGLCLQAYLRRTPGDLDRLLPLQPRIRLVKGAYHEPAAIALTRRAEIDAAFLDIARRLLPAVERGQAELALATHDLDLLERLGDAGCEVQMLYGIRPADQRRLAAAGRRVRVLISYGSEWFAWYMRRLAEHPANVALALRAALSAR